VPSRLLGELVMNEMQQLDEIAYILLFLQTTEGSRGR